MTWSAIVGSWRALVVLALAALGVRVALYVLWVRHTGGFGDFGFYHEQAKLLAAGKGWIEPYDHAFGVDHASAGHPPLWPLVLSVPALLGFDSVDTNRLVGALLGCVVVVLVAVVAARLAGRRAGVVAGGLAAVHPVLVGADLSLLSETLYGLFAPPLRPGRHRAARPRPDAAGRALRAGRGRRRRAGRPDPGRGGPARGCW